LTRRVGPTRPSGLGWARFARVRLSAGFFALLAFPEAADAQTAAFVPEDPQPERLPLEEIHLPEGFEITLYAEGMPNARQMTLGEQGTLFVSTRTSGNVYAVRDGNGDGQGDGVLTIASGLHMPNGVAMREGDLYVAEVNRVLRYDDIEDKLEDPPAPAVVYDDLPTEEWHGWKFIAFGPDGWLYVPVGAPCNVCERKDERYASIQRMKFDGSGIETFARGVRNSVGFDWHPVTGELWFTDNGRDLLGDDSPPCELNHAPAKGLHFGFPYCHGARISDPEFGTKRKCSEFRPPAQELGAHVAPLGMRFYDGTTFPQEYRNQIFIPEHGSWNRSTANGYRVTLVRLDEKGQRALSYEVFASGWLRPGGQEAWGRPVDCFVMPDGALLVSDDRAGAVYRIQYGGN
jgi:glucose/arabinose dehydrogenase